MQREYYNIATDSVVAWEKDEAEDVISSVELVAWELSKLFDADARNRSKVSIPTVEEVERQHNFIQNNRWLEMPVPFVY